AGGTLVIEPQNQLIPSTSITDLSRYTLDQMDVLCPATRMRDTLAGGVDVDLVLPKLITMNGVQERLYQSCGHADPTTCPVATVDLAEDFDGNGSAETPVTYELYASYALACADKVVRPILLHPIDGPEARSANPDGSAPLFSTFFRYFCV